MENSCQNCLYGKKRSVPVDEGFTDFETQYDCRRGPLIAVADWYDGKTVMRGPMHAMPYVCKQHQKTGE